LASYSSCAEVKDECSCRSTSSVCPYYVGRDTTFTVSVLGTTKCCNLMHWYKPVGDRQRLKCDGTRAETRFRLSPKRTCPFKSAGASVQSTTGSRGVRISDSNAGYTMFRGSVKSTGYPLHSPVSPSLPLPCVTVCHPISNAVYTLPPFSG
jgi:hypothetical protein